MHLSNQQHLFNLPEDITYLNIAAISPSFKSIEEAGVNAVLKKSRPYLIPSSDFFDPVAELKQLFAKIIDTEEYNRIATIPSVSYGMAVVANNIVLKESDEIILVDEQFPSNYYVWEKLAKKYNATLKIITQPETKEGYGKQWNEDILNAIHENTALITMGQTHWSNGTLFDLKSIRKKATECDSLLIIDGSQSVGAFPFSIKEIQPDALVCAGYKWLFGPYGCAYAYYGEYFDHGEPLEENWANRLYSENLAGLTEYQPEYKPLASRYTMGESGNFIYVQMQIAALKQLLKWNPSSIQEYCKEITSDFVKELRDLGYFIESDAYRTHHMFGIKLPNSIQLEALKEKLTDQKIFVSFRGSFLRVSCHLYNTRKQFSLLSRCIQESI